ncbi:MAG: DMT family transporter, partial [Proteobacteria bacterium]|nr:DMT family transporter [Pseudomonadota bacterium]
LGTLVSLISGLLFLGLLSLFLQFDDLAALSLSALALLALVGILNFAIGRYFNFISISHLGVGRATPIIASSPLFAMIIAVVFTGESVSAATLLGTALILAGVYVTLRVPAPRVQADARGDVGLQIAADLGQVQRARPLFTRELVLALLIGDAPKRFADPRGLHREMPGGRQRAGLLERGQQLQRAAARLQQPEARIQCVHAGRRLAGRESLLAQYGQQPVRQRGMALCDAGDAGQQLGQALGLGRLEGEHGGVSGLVSHWYSCRWRGPAMPASRLAGHQFPRR